MLEFTQHIGAQLPTPKNSGIVGSVLQLGAKFCQLVTSLARIIGPFAQSVYLNKLTRLPGS